MLVLQFSREWIMTRLDWTSQKQFFVYFGSRMVGTTASEVFFAHMRQHFSALRASARLLDMLLRVSVHASVYRGENPRRIASGCNGFQLTERTSSRSPAATLYLISHCEPLASPPSPGYVYFSCPPSPRCAALVVVFFLIMSFSLLCFLCVFFMFSSSV